MVWVWEKKKMCQEKYSLAVKSPKDSQCVIMFSGRVIRDFMVLRLHCNWWCSKVFKALGYNYIVAISQKRYCFFSPKRYILWMSIFECTVYRNMFPGVMFVYPLYTLLCLCWDVPLYRLSYMNNYHDGLWEEHVNNARILNTPAEKYTTLNNLILC